LISCLFPIIISLSSREQGTSYTMRSVIVCLFLGLLYVNGIFAKAACNEQTNCDACTGMSECGWCAPTQTCLNGTKLGPFNSTCIGDSWEFGKCTPCAQFTDCRTCIARDTDCFWCQTINNGLGGCRDIGFVGCSYTRKCPCNIYGSCTECANDVDCQWCGNDLTCVLANTTGTCNGTQPVYNYTTTCPCAANRDCPNCQATDGCSWCEDSTCLNQCTGPKVLSCAAYCNAAATTCDQCTATPGCAWCAPLGTCVDAATSPCPYTYSCPMCSAATYCDTCLSFGGDCTWCENTQDCQPTGTGCLAALNCVAFCNQFSSCTECNKVRGCGWCDDTNVCGDVSTTNCFYSHTCNAPPPPTPTPSPTPAPKCGFNGGAFVGGMFFVIGVAVLIVGAYLFYRWRTGRKFDYRELK